MEIKGIINEDFVNYKKPCMVIEFPHCSFKCDKECGRAVCQNSPMVLEPNIIIAIEQIIEKYLKNDITQAIVMQGLEPFDSWCDMTNFIFRLRECYDCNDDIVIYTGYNKDEIQEQLNYLKFYKNIIIKFGRFIPDQTPHYDEVLGVNLASDNQYAEKIS